MTIIIARTAFSLFLFCSIFSGWSHAQGTLSVGVVPQFDARRTVETWQPILEKVSKLSGIQLELKTSPQHPCFRKAV